MTTLEIEAGSEIQGRSPSECVGVAAEYFVIGPEEGADEDHWEGSEAEGTEDPGWEEDACGTETTKWSSPIHPSSLAVKLSVCMPLDRVGEE